MGAMEASKNHLMAMRPDSPSETQIVLMPAHPQRTQAARMERHGPYPKPKPAISSHRLSPQTPVGFADRRRP